MENPNWLCRLRLHKWRDCGKTVTITWKEPEVSRTSTHSRKVLTEKMCLRCGIRMKRRIIRNPDGTLSCVGWDLIPHNEY